MFLSPFYTIYFKDSFLKINSQTSDVRTAGIIPKPTDTLHSWVVSASGVPARGNVKPIRAVIRRPETTPMFNAAPKIVLLCAGIVSARYKLHADRITPAAKAYMKRPTTITQRLRTSIIAVEIIATRLLSKIDLRLPISHIIPADRDPIVIPAIADDDIIVLFKSVSSPHFIWSAIISPTTLLPPSANPPCQQHIMMFAEMPTRTQKFVFRFYQTS